MEKEWMTPIVYVIAIIFSTFVIVSLFAINMDNQSQTYCNDAIHEFIDNSRASGYISATSYIEFREKLNNTGNLYDITISHDSKAAHPAEDNNGNIVEGAYTNGKSAYNQDEILAYMFEGGSDNFRNYPLKEGDYIKASYSLKDSTFSGKLMKVWLNIKGKNIRGSYGGYVGSVEENGTATGGN